jgi:hypothetical protein
MRRFHGPRQAMMVVMMTLIVLGFLLEATGLLLTARGLWRTWRANSAGRDFLSPRLRHAVNWIMYSLLRRPRPVVTLGLNATLRRDEAAMHGTVFQEFRDDMTIDERADIAQANALSALEAAGAAQSAIADEQRERKAGHAQLDERITGTESDLTTFARSLVVDGIPLAVGGLGLAAVGLLLQSIASGMGVS